MPTKSDAEKYKMLAQYVRWSSTMRGYYDAAFAAVARAGGATEEEMLTDEGATDRVAQGASRALIDRMMATMVCWYATLYVVVEGWDELELQDTAADRLLSNAEYVSRLRRLRHGLCHFQHGFDDDRFANFFNADAEVTTWAIKLHDAFIAHFARHPRWSEQLRPGKSEPTHSHLEAARAIAALLSLVGVGTSLLTSDSCPLTDLTRQTVLLAIARRALVTASAVALLAKHGLVEPTLATMRTLLELEIRAVAVVDDPTDQAARFQVACAYAHAAGTLRSALADPEVAAELAIAGRADVDAALAELDTALAEPVFATVVERAKAQPTRWHGKDNLFQACTALGISGDYRQLYGPASTYVHGAEPDRDIDELSDGKRALRSVTFVGHPAITGAVAGAVYHLRAVLLMALIGERVERTTIVTVRDRWSAETALGVLRIEQAFARVAGIWG